MPQTRLAVAGLLLGLVLAASGAARADVFFFDGVHGVEFLNGAKDEVAVSGSGVATASPSAGAGSGPLQTLELTAPFATFMTKTRPSISSQIEEIRLMDVRIDPTLQGGVFKPIFDAAVNGTPPELSARTLPLQGRFTICLNTACDNNLTQLLPAKTLLGKAVGTGIGGTFMLGNLDYYFTFSGAPWTVGKTSVAYQTKSGTKVKVATGYVKVHGMTLPRGTLQLVTSTKVNAVGTTITTTGFISRLTIRFQPEPGKLALLGSGAVGLVLLGRRRIRR